MRFEIPLFEKIQVNLAVPSQGLRGELRIAVSSNDAEINETILRNRSGFYS